MRVKVLFLSFHTGLVDKYSTKKYFNRLNISSTDLVKEGIRAVHIYQEPYLSPTILKNATNTSMWAGTHLKRLFVCRINTRFLLTCSSLSPFLFLITLQYGSLTFLDPFIFRTSEWRGVKDSFVVYRRTRSSIKRYHGSLTKCLPSQLSYDFKGKMTGSSTFYFFSYNEYVLKSMHSQWTFDVHHGVMQYKQPSAPYKISDIARHENFVYAASYLVKRQTEDHVFLCTLMTRKGRHFSNWDEGQHFTAQSGLIAIISLDSSWDLLME